MVRAYKRTLNTTEVGRVARGSFLQIMVFMPKEDGNPIREPYTQSLVGPVRASLIPLPFYPILTDTSRPTSLQPGKDPAAGFIFLKYLANISGSHCFQDPACVSLSIALGAPPHISTLFPRMCILCPAAWTHHSRNTARNTGWSLGRVCLTESTVPVKLATFLSIWFFLTQSPGNCQSPENIMPTSPHSITRQ